MSRYDECEFRRPTLQISGDDIRSVFQEPNGPSRRLCVGKLNRQKQKIEWNKPRSTSASPFPRDTTQSEAASIQCGVGAKGEINSQLGPGPPESVRFRQLAFVERQEGDDLTFLGDAPFFAAAAGNRAALQAARLAGRVVRAWSFQAGDETTPHANMAATDEPTRPQYLAYLAQSGAIA